VAGLGEKAGLEFKQKKEKLHQAMGQSLREVEKAWGLNKDDKTVIGTTAFLIMRAKNKTAHSINAQAALNKKMRAVVNAQKNSVKTREFPDGRIRYYDAERQSNILGPTRGVSMVTEYNPKTGQVRIWNECYDHKGNVNRIHPKMIDGQDVVGQHYPPTKIETGLLKNPTRK
jgi:hypothetical protein